ncbi:kunitz-type protease inhibitor 2-like [Plectropomus leopardus]|uniref:kunitz-type protease inhibitor 2-like n=1 Tax=Plectropomus leopardus TaxID=160734 RepID=UPI001C4C8B6B|nr:kunitz-type protease inhibitor 2-like [Plectropomus leopardus]
MEKSMILFSVLLLGWTWTFQGVPADEQVEGTESTTTDEEGPTVNATLREAAVFNATEDCQKAPESGPCLAYIPRLFYNSTSKRCEEFIYGGCRGNLNNFISVSVCLETCHRAGEEYKPHWLYFRQSEFQLDRKTDRMEKSMILFSVLLLGWTWTFQGVPADEQVEGTESTTTDEEGPTVNATLREAAVFNATEDCQKAPETGPCKAYIPRFFYNSTSMRCEEFTYGGCMGNLNNFADVSVCLEKCHHAEEKEEEEEEEENPTAQSLDS